MPIPIKSPLLPALAAATLLTATASAAITVSNTSSGLFSTNASGNFSITYDVINSGSVVVVGFYTDAGNSAVSSVGFGTGVGNQLSNQLLSQARSALAYFSNPSTDSGLSFSGIAGANVANAGYFIWELSGVDLLAVAATAIGTNNATQITTCLLYTSPSPRDKRQSRMPSSA